jgi:hypothetical protein
MEEQPDKTESARTEIPELDSNVNVDRALQSLKQDPEIISIDDGMKKSLRQQQPENVDSPKTEIFEPDSKSNLARPEHFWKQPFDRLLIDRGRHSD